MKRKRRSNNVVLLKGSGLSMESFAIWLDTYMRFDFPDERIPYLKENYRRSKYERFGKW